jgi:hypothetical protein
MLWWKLRKLKSRDLQVLARTAYPDQAFYEQVLKGREAWALWENLLSKSERC